MSEWISSSFNDFGSVSTDSIASYSRTLRQKSQSGPDKSLPHVSHHSLGKALPRSRLRKQRTSGSHEDSTVCGQASSLKGTSGRLSSKGSLKADLWCDIYSPENVAELALHKRKVETISLWLSESTKSTPKHLAHILVVKGAPGIGKSTAIRLIAVSLGLELVEFISSSGVRFTDGLEMTLMRSLHRWPEHDSGVFDNSESQSLMFRSFLLRANKYSSLQFENGLDLCLKKVIFVEDVPNVFYRDASEFHTILRTFRLYGRCPLVFVVNELTSGSSDVQRLFPLCLQAELNIESISVKPVSPTMMAKVLYRIAASETQQDDSLHSSWPCIIGHIVESSGGDIRSAINALQFASRRDNSDDITLSTQWRPKSKSSLSSTSNSARRHQRTDRCVRPPAGGDPPTDVPVLVAKDATCFLFHALGKIFYFKRRDSVADGEDGCDLPQHLGQHHRDPLLLEPEEVVAKSRVDTGLFISFLHQNCLAFLSTVEDVSRALTYFSDGDLLSSQYTTRELLQDYSVSVATRGLIHSDSAVRHGRDCRTTRGWRPLHKSQWHPVQRLYRERREAAVCLFSGQHHCSADSLLTELIPYIGLTNHTLHSPGQIALMQTLTQFPRSCCRSTLETLQEKSFVGENVDDDGVDPKHVTDQQSMSTNNGSDIFTDQLASMRSSDGGLYYDDLHMDRDKNLARTSHTLKDDRDVYGIEECDE